MIRDVVLRFPAQAAGERQSRTELPVILNIRSGIEDVSNCVGVACRVANLLWICRGWSFDCRAVVLIGLKYECAVEAGVGVIRIAAIAKARAKLDGVFS